MRISPRATAVIIASVAFAACLLFLDTVGTTGNISIIGGADGPTAVYVAYSGGGKELTEPEKRAMQRIQLQARLAQALGTLDGVNTAKVELSENCTSAAVSILMHPGKELTAEQHDGVIRLVRNAVGPDILPADGIALTTITMP